VKDQSAFSVISGRHASVCARPEKSDASYQFLFLPSKYRNLRMQLVKRAKGVRVTGEGSGMGI